MGRKTITIKASTIITIMLIALLGLVGINQYLIYSISTTGRIVAQVKQTGEIQSGIQSGTGVQSDIVQRIYEEVVPKEGTKTEYGLVFSNQGLQALVNYQQSIELNGNEQQRYIRLGTSQDTACEYCCGIGERGSLREDGNIACGCSHNIALAISK
jgi:hypothetical protein